MESKPMSSSGRLLALMGIGLLGLVVVAGIVVAFREPASFEPGSPEAAVQTYILAVLDEDADAAHAMLSPELQSRCEISDLVERSYRKEGGRITLQDSTVKGETAVVEVEFTASYSENAFDFYQYSYDERFDLKLIQGEWRISDVPWPYYWCPEAKP